MKALLPVPGAVHLLAACALGLIFSPAVGVADDSTPSIIEGLPGDTTPLKVGDAVREALAGNADLERACYAVFGANLRRPGDGGAVAADERCRAREHANRLRLADCLGREDANDILQHDIAGV